MWEKGHGVQDVFCPSPAAERWWQGSRYPHGRGATTRAGERRTPVTRGAAGPWRGQRRSLARLSVRSHPSAPLTLSPCINVTVRSCPGGAGRGSWRLPLTLTRRGSGAAEQMFPATGTTAWGARGGTDVTGSDKAPVLAHGAGAASHGSCLVPVARLWLWHGSRTPTPPDLWHCTATPCPSPPANRGSHWGAGMGGSHKFWV